MEKYTMVIEGLECNYTGEIALCFYLCIIVIQRR